MVEYEIRCNGCSATGDDVGKVVDGVFHVYAHECAQPGEGMSIRGPLLHTTLFPAG